MKIISIIKNLGRPVLISGLGGLLSLGVYASAWGTCVQDKPGAEPVIAYEGDPQSCAGIDGQFGCKVKFRDANGGTVVSGCAVSDEDGRLFKIVAQFDAENGLSWRIKDSADGSPLRAKVNTLILNSDGNSCSYVYGNEAAAGTGQGWLSNDVFAGVDTAYFCTDGETDDKPAPKCDPNACAVISPDEEELFVITLKPGADDWNPKECTCFEPQIWTACEEETTSDNEGVNKCTGNNPLDALPVLFEAGNDGTWICRTIGGERKCWRR